MNKTENELLSFTLVKSKGMPYEPACTNIPIKV